MLSQSSQVTAFLTSVSISAERRCRQNPAADRLLVAQVVLVLARGQVLFGDELVAQRSGREDSDLAHHVYSKYARLIDSRNSP